MAPDKDCFCVIPRHEATPDLPHLYLRIACLSIVPALLRFYSLDLGERSVFAFVLSCTSAQFLIPYTAIAIIGAGNDDLHESR